MAKDTVKTIDLTVNTAGRPITERMWGLSVPCVRVDPLLGAWSDDIELTLYALQDELNLPDDMPLTMDILRVGTESGLRDVVVYGSSKDGRPSMVTYDNQVLATGPLVIIGLKGSLTDDERDDIMDTLHAGWWHSGDGVMATARVIGYGRDQDVRERYREVE